MVIEISPVRQIQKMYCTVYSSQEKFPLSFVPIYYS